MKVGKGGKQPGAGRPPAAYPRSVIFKIRLTKAEHAQLIALGGSPWVRAQLIAEKQK